MNKKDKRSRKTARAVQNALLRLLCERRIDEIKIFDLCTAADINRTTFYLHYAGITDVLDELRDEITERVFAATDLVNVLNQVCAPVVVGFVMAGLLRLAFVPRAVLARSKRLARGSRFRVRMALRVAALCVCACVLALMRTGPRRPPP